MSYYLLCILFLILEKCILRLHGADIQDYCMNDGFHAECPTGEMLIMEVALYGRMEYRECLKYDIGLNCQSDVLSYMDSRCSGQNTCEVDLKIFFFLTNDCQELPGFLRAKYTCLPVIDIKHECCRMTGNHSEYMHMHVEGGYMAGNMEVFACVETVCPLTVQVPRGQHMGISVYNFNTSLPAIETITSSRVTYHDSRCFAYINIQEEGLGIRIPLCALDVRKQHVYTSSTDHMEMNVATKEGIKVSRFVIIFEVIGCPDPVPPINGFVERNGNHVTIGCIGLDHVFWELTCQNNQWHGISGNCSEGELNNVKVKTSQVPELQFSPGVAMTLILSLALIISISIIVIGIVCVRRFRDNNAILERDRFASSQCKTYITERHSVDMPKRCDFIEIQDMEQSRSEPNLLVNDMRNKIPDYSTKCSHNVPNYTQRNLVKPNDQQSKLPPKYQS